MAIASQSCASRSLASATSETAGRHLRLLPRDYYVRPEVFEKEIDKIFHRQWLFLGHVSQVRQIGDYFVEDVAGESIIVVRESAERISGYLNVCRHRGHPLCQDAAGRVSRFTCPYHRWTYGLDGVLRRVPGATDGQDLAFRDWGLHRVHVEAWNGFIFGWLGEHEPPSLASRLAFDDDDLGKLAPIRIKEVFRESYDLNANWKVLLENYLECYHCLGAHPELCVSMDVEATYANTEADWKGEYFSGRLQLRPGIKTGSMDGRLVSKPLGIFAVMDELPDDFGAGFGIVPALTRVIFHIDHAIAHTLRPIDVGHVRWLTRWYVRDDAVEGKDFEVDKLTAVWRATNREDIALCEGAYRGVRSRRFVSGPLDRRSEAAIHSALQTYLDLMNAPD